MNQKCKKCGKPSGKYPFCKEHLEELAKELKIKYEELFCQECGQLKNFFDKPLCYECWAKKKVGQGYRRCAKCGKIFLPNEKYHAYCNDCFFAKK